MIRSGCVTAHALRHPKVGGLRNNGAPLFNLSPLSARCGVDLRELWRFCVDRCMAVGHSPGNNFTYAYAP